jgi:hypothetical protein
MTRTEEIKAKYDASEISRKAALDHLEALGMWRDDADSYLAKASAVPSQDRGAL